MKEMDLAVLTGEAQTMTSSQFAEMTGRELKSINRTIREQFSEEIDGCIGTPSLDSRGYVTDYHLPETESIMLAAMLDKSYLRKISEFWKNRYDNLSGGEKMLLHAKGMLRVEREQARLAVKQDTMFVEQERIKAKVAQIADGDGYFSIIAFANLNGLNFDHAAANAAGKKAAAVCRARKLRIGKVKHPVFGKINAYPEYVLIELFGKQ